MATKKAPVLVAADLDPTKKARLYKLLADLHDASGEVSAAQVKLDAAKASLKEEFFKDLPEGTSNATLEYGKKLVLKQPIYRKVDSDVLDAAIAEKKLTAAEINAVIKYTPECIVGGFKALDKDAKLKWGDIITETPGAINFKIENIAS